VTTDGKEEMYDVGIPSASEAELAVGKYLQISDHLSIKAIEALSVSAVKALGLGPGEIRLRRLPCLIINRRQCGTSLPKRPRRATGLLRKLTNGLW
jgi:hypothetical protein